MLGARTALAPGVSPLLIRIVLLVLALAIAAGIALALRRRDRRVLVVPSGDVLTSADLTATTPGTAAPGTAQQGPELGSAATFVQFSSPVCSGCRATARVLDQIVAGHPGVHRVEIDVTQRLDLARRLDIMHTPTTVVLGPGGQVVSRLSGVPTRDQALTAAALAPATPSLSQP
jgi:thiol-disulfide isomerase/thioredoxin